MVDKSLWYNKVQKETLEEMGTEKATRYNEGKLKWTLPDYQSLEPLIRVMMWGEEHYGRDNWKKGVNREECLDSLMRHTLALQQGKIFDDGPNGTGECHIGGVLFNAMLYEYCRINNKFVDESKV